MRKNIVLRAGRSGCHCALTALVASCLGSGIGSVAAAAPPVATISYGVDGQESIVALPGVHLANGNASYVATYMAPDKSWTFSYIIISDYKNNPVTSLTGFITVTNNSSTQRVFDCGISVPICPAITNGSLLGGFVKLTLNSDFGGGSVACAGAQPVIKMLTDAVPQASFFHCPFMLAATGAGTSSTTATFGLPGPNGIGPNKVEAIGERQHFLLSPGDSTTVQVTFLYKDVDGVAIEPCSADLNFDGMVNNSDLRVLFMAWGQTTFCPSELPADLNGDGVVGSADIFVLLDNWGPCADALR